MLSLAGGTIVHMTESAMPVEPAAADPLPAGKVALSGHAWQDAFDLLSRADREASLSGADLESLAEAAFFAGHAELAVEVKERAYKTHLAAEDDIRAAYIALDVANGYGQAG